MSLGSGVWAKEVLESEELQKGVHWVLSRQDSPGRNSTSSNMRPPLLTNHSARLSTLVPPRRGPSCSIGVRTSLPLPASACRCKLAGCEAVIARTRVSWHASPAVFIGSILERPVTRRHTSSATGCFHACFQAWGRGCGAACSALQLRRGLADLVPCSTGAYGCKYVGLPAHQCRMSQEAHI